MKILMACTPATGHINPLVTIARMLVEAGHEVVFQSAGAFQSRIEGSGARFQKLLGNADVDFRDMNAVIPELAEIEPGFKWLCVAMERAFIDRIGDQHASLQRGLESFAADAIVTDDMFFGVVPMLLDARAARPSVMVCGTSILHVARSDGAPLFLGLPPAASEEDRAECARLAAEYHENVDAPMLDTLNAELARLGLAPMTIPLFESIVLHADTYVQLSVPGFEFPRDEVPAHVNFVGALPMIPNQAPIPSWAAELDGTRKVVLVTQGTVANHDFGLLVAPTLAALANEPDVLVVATAGGRATGTIPGPIPANARVADYLPFEWLLPKVDVLVTNGGYGSVNQALSFGIPIVAAGLTEDKADVNARIAWSGAGINLCTNTPAPEAIRSAVRTMLDTPDHRGHAQRLAAEYARHDARATILRLLGRESATKRARAA